MILFYWAVVESLAIEVKSSRIKLARASLAERANTIVRDRILISKTLRQLPQRHTELMEALSKKYPDAAERVIREHLRYGHENVQAAIRTRLSRDFPRTRPLTERDRTTVINLREGAWRIESCRGFR